MHFFDREDNSSIPQPANNATSSTIVENVPINRCCHWSILITPLFTPYANRQSLSVSDISVELQAVIAYFTECYNKADIAGCVSTYHPDCIAYKPDQRCGHGVEGNDVLNIHVEPTICFLTSNITLRYCPPYIFTILH